MAALNKHSSPLDTNSVPRRKCIDSLMAAREELMEVPLVAKEQQEVMPTWEEAMPLSGEVMTRVEAEAAAG